LARGGFFGPRVRRGGKGEKVSAEEHKALFDEFSTDRTSPGEEDGGRGRRICFALETLDVGGAETHALTLAEYLKARGWDVRFAVMRKARGPLAARCRSGAIALWDGLMPSRRGWAVVKRLGRLASEWRFDVLFVVECFYLNALAGFGAAVKKTGARAYAVIHNWPSRREFSHPALFRLRVGLMGRIFDRVIFIAERQRDHYEKRLGIRFERSGVITSGIDVERFSPGELAKDPIRIEKGERHARVATVGSLQPRKGHEYFLRAAVEILARRDDVEFLVIGDGPRRGELRRLAADLGIGDHVHFLGVRDDLPDLLRAVDIVVLASHEAAGGHSETLPLVLLEAGATGLPVVATDVGAVSDIVVDGRTGFLVPQRDWRALAERIERLLSDEPLRRQMGAIARERTFAKFNAGRMCRSFERLFRTGDVK